MSSPSRASRFSDRSRTSVQSIWPGLPAWRRCSCTNNPSSAPTTSRRSSVRSISTATSASSISPRPRLQSMSTEAGQRSIAVAITGASGAIYATRTMAALLERGCHLELVISDYGRRLLRDELGDAASVDKLTDYLVSRYGSSVRKGTTTLYSNKDLGARIASGSQGCQGMVVVPCSMKTLAGIAHGLSRNLVERAADVMLKERRPLIIVPRETPMSLPQLKNMVLCAEAGAMVMPAMPAFYQMPQTLDDLADFMAGKILSALGFEHELYPAWKG